MQALQHHLLLPLVVLLAAVSMCRGYNITRILAGHPEFSTFNHYLSATHLAEEINSRLTITVLVVDNSAMSAILAKHPGIYTIKNMLSLQILADYFGAKKLHQVTHRSALVASLFQATGAAPGTTGFVNITNFKGGRVGFGAEDNNGILDASFVKSVKEIPYNISVIQISHILNSPEADAPAPAPTQYNITILMEKKGCKVFADLVSSTAGLEKSFEDSIDTGLTIFCPIDLAMNKFMPKYKKLTPKGKASLLLYHALPEYNSMQMLKTSIGNINTLATDGSTSNYNYTFQNSGELVSIETRISTAKVTGTVIDEQPLAIYTVDKVLEPNELFKVPDAAPAPKGEVAASSPADSPGGDSTASDLNGGGMLGSRGRWAAAMMVAFLVGGVAGI